MLPGPVYLLADAPIGVAPIETERSLVAFLRALPGDAGSVVINGDLFDFWFEWKHALPRVGLRVLGELPAASCIENHHAPSRLAVQVVRVAHGIRLVQVAQRVRQKRSGERVAPCAVRLSGVRGEHGPAILWRGVRGRNGVRRGCRRVRGSGEKSGREEGEQWGGFHRGGTVWVGHPKKLSPSLEMPRRRWRSIWRSARRVKI
jgi:hypothetical protein